MLASQACTPVPGTNQHLSYSQKSSPWGSGPRAAGTAQTGQSQYRVVLNKFVLIGEWTTCGLCCVHRVPLDQSNCSFSLLNGRTNTAASVAGGFSGLWPESPAPPRNVLKSTFTPPPRDLQGWSQKPAEPTCLFPSRGTVLPILLPLPHQGGHIGGG